MMKYQWRQSNNKYTRARNYKSWASVGLGVAGLRPYLDRLAPASRLVLPSISPKFHYMFEASLRDGRQHTYTPCIASAKRWCRRPCLGPVWSGGWKKGFRRHMHRNMQCSKYIDNRMISTICYLKASMCVGAMIDDVR